MSAKLRLVSIKSVSLEAVIRAAIERELGKLLARCRKCKKFFERHDVAMVGCGVCSANFCFCHACGSLDRARTATLCHVRYFAGKGGQRLGEFKHHDLWTAYRNRSARRAA